jgi:hypothetical protein
MAQRRFDATPVDRFKVMKAAPMSGAAFTCIVLVLKCPCAGGNEYTNIDSTKDAHRHAGERLFRRFLSRVQHPHRRLLGIGYVQPCRSLGRVGVTRLERLVEPVDLTKARR